MSRTLDLTCQPGQPCVRCDKATDSFVYIVDRKVPMCPDCSICFEDYLAEKGGPLPCPPVLYRYRAPSDVKPCPADGPSWFEQFLTTDQVWASNPTQFNDPYDCRQTYDFAASPEEWEKRVDHGIVGASAGYLGAAGKLQLYSEQLEALGTGLKKEAKYNDPAVQADMGRLMQEFLDKARVLCLCETQTNPRLWAHYADGHRGFCLEFDTSMEPFRAYRVRYTRDYPKLGINATPDQCLRTFLLTKSELWKDEQEWRCVLLEGGPAQWPIPQRALKAVIFGTRASADLRATITQLIAVHKPWVALREVVEVPFSYDLQVRPLPGAAAVQETPHRRAPNPGPQPDGTAGAAPRG
ncbi:MAG TPA: DUF2971 domain-containing protein [Thermoanaerobaculia bacterium]|jgi:hypothetical protein|nr:DUF2971 domain-containing protein [Thermoanaerobaculia bacterium]